MHKLLPSTKTACKHTNIILCYANYDQKDMHTKEYAIDVYELRPPAVMVHHTCTHSNMDKTGHDLAPPSLYK